MIITSHLCHENNSSSAQASASDPEIIYLSISTPPLSPEVLLRNGLPDCTLQDIRRWYCDIADIVEPPKEGFVLTLRLDFAKLPQSRGMKSSFSMFILARRYLHSGI